jgi:hypothetical protein
VFRDEFCLCGDAFVAFNDFRRYGSKEVRFGSDDGVLELVNTDISDVGFVADRFVPVMTFESKAVSCVFFHESSVFGRASSLKTERLVLSRSRFILRNPHYLHRKSPWSSQMPLSFSFQTSNYCFSPYHVDSLICRILHAVIEVMDGTIWVTSPHPR